MSNQSNDLTPRQDRAIAALLTCRTIAEAARQAQVGERSIYRWLTESDFQSQLRLARRQHLSQTLGRLQHVAQGAIDALHTVIHDEKASSASRVSAARAALRYACDGVEIDDFEQRLAELEQARRRIEERKQGGGYP